MAINGYVECAVCHYQYEGGTIGRDFVGFAKKEIVPQRRWYSASEVKKVRFALSVPLCEKCGGEKEKHEYKVQVHKNAVAAWKDVDKHSELAKYMPKYAR